MPRSTVSHSGSVNGSRSVVPERYTTRARERDSDDSDVDVRSTFSYGMVADRGFASVAVALDPVAEAAAMSGAAAENGSPRDPTTKEGHVLTMDDIAAMSPTTRGRSDVNAAAIASGFDFRYVPPERSSSARSRSPVGAKTRGDANEEGRGGTRATRRGRAGTPLPSRPYQQSKAAQLAPGVDCTGAASGDLARGKGDGDICAVEEGGGWRDRFSFGDDRLVPAASGAAGVDDLLFTLGEVTYDVLVYFFPRGYETDGDGGADGRGKREGEEAKDVREGTDSDPSTPPETARGRPDIYRMPFLNSVDARSATTFPPEGRSSASDDATADATPLHLLFLLSRLAVPVALTQLLRTGMGIITTAFMGHYLSTEQFAAAATGLAFTNLTALNIGNGFSAALDTLATQEHGRQKHSPKIVAILLRGIICTFAVYIPIAVFYFFCEPALALVIHEDLVADTAYFLRMSVFIATPMILNNNLLKFAQAQKMTQLGVVSSTSGILLLAPLLFLFRGKGIPGIVVALSIDRFCVLAIVVYSMLQNKGLTKCWRGCTMAEHVRSVVYHPGEFLRFVKVGLPVLGANCADSWAFEALGIVAANIGATATAAWSVIMAIYSLLFAVHIGIAAAAAIRIGNAVGARKGLLAKKYVLATIIFSCSCTGFCVAAMWLLGEKMFSVMQGNPEVSKRGGSVSFLAGWAFVADSLFYVLQGPFRGVGYNGVLLFIVAGAMWGLTVPLAVILGVELQYNLEGILVSLLLGMIVAVPVQTAFLLVGVPWQRYDTPTATRDSAEDRDSRGEAVREDPPAAATGAVKTPADAQAESQQRRPTGGEA